MQDNLKVIKQAVATASELPNASIEYNFAELPEHEEVREKSFFGIPAYLNKSRMINTTNVVRKFQ